MVMSLRPLLFSVLAVALLAAVLAHRFAPRLSACAAADKADAAGLYQQAQDAYVAVLSGDAGEHCAQIGLLRTVGEHCTTIGILAAEGAAPQARKTYMSILALDLPVVAGSKSASSIRSCAKRGMRSSAASTTTPASTESE
jgi:hypothetical protein